MPKKGVSESRVREAGRKVGKEGRMEGREGRRSRAREETREGGQMV